MLLAQRVSEGIWDPSLTRRVSIPSLTRRASIVTELYNPFTFPRPSDDI